MINYLFLCMNWYVNLNGQTKLEIDGLTAVSYTHLLRIHKPAGLVRERAMQRDDIGIFEKRVELRPLITLCLLYTSEIHGTIIDY